MNPKIKKGVKGLVLSVLLTGLICGGLLLMTGIYVYGTIDVSDFEIQKTQPTIFYDKDGNPFTELSNRKVDYVKLEDISQVMQKAMVAVEDNRFYDHSGVDPRGILRAAVVDMKAGSMVQGGSTITQQLAKNLLYSAEKSITRKFKEAVTAVKLERVYEKTEILEMYLNSIYFGEGAWGIQNAAEMYFGKEASELTLPEAALLAGLPKAPSHYSPYDYPDQARERRDLVLRLMNEQGLMSADYYETANQSELTVMQQNESWNAVNHPAYVDAVILEAMNQYNLDEESILGEGLHIYTNMDPKVQQAVEKVYSQPDSFPENQGGLQSGMILLDAKSGAVRGLAGQIGSSGSYRSFNYAIQSHRQPGSSIKPVAVYAPALKEGFQTGDLILDKETDFGEYTPLNYGDRFHGWVTVEEALIHSYNIPAVALLKEVGIGDAMDFVEKSGIPLAKEDRSFGLALGGTSRGASPLHLAQAYTMFANQGIRSLAFHIQKIEDQNGNMIVEGNTQQEKMLEPDTAFEMTMMLRKVVTEGTGTNANMDRPVAGKTGTTQLPDLPEFQNEQGETMEGNKDAWFVGYTPELVGAVWLGYPQTDREHYLTSTGGRYPATIFKAVITSALEGEAVKTFQPPEGYMRGGQGEIRYINGERPVINPAPETDDEEKDDENSEKDDENDEGKNEEKNEGESTDGNTTDDGTTDDGSVEEESTDGNTTDEGTTDDGSGGEESTDGSTTGDGTTDDGSGGEESTDGSTTGDGTTDDGSGEEVSTDGTVE